MCEIQHAVTIELTNFLPLQLSHNSQSVESKGLR